MRKTAFKKANSLNALRAHVMSYVVPAIEGRLYFGPAPRTLGDAYYLAEELHVTHIVNIQPETDAQAWNGLNRASAYMAHFESPGDDDDDDKKKWSCTKPPALVRDVALPSETPLEQQSDVRQIKFFTDAARKIKTLVFDDDTAGATACVYIHNRDGTREEAFVAFLVWYLLDAATSPHKDVMRWITEQDYLQVLRDDEDIALLTKMTDTLKRTGKSAGAALMDRFFGAPTASKRPKMTDQ